MTRSDSKKRNVLLHSLLLASLSWPLSLLCNCSPLALLARVLTILTRLVHIQNGGGLFFNNMIACTTGLIPHTLRGDCRCHVHATMCTVHVSTRFPG